MFLLGQTRARESARLGRLRELPVSFEFDPLALERTDLMCSMGTLTVGSDYRLAVEEAGANRLLERRTGFDAPVTAIDVDGFRGSLARSKGIARDVTSSPLPTLDSINLLSFLVFYAALLYAEPAYEVSVLSSLFDPTSRS